MKTTNKKGGLCLQIEELRNGAWSAKICVDRGANCISLRHAGYGISVLREPDYDNGLDNPYLYGMPILFPVNRISGGHFSFQGRDYRFPINEAQTNCHLHGFLHEQPFAIEQRAEDLVTCAFGHRGDPMVFPQDFCLRITYALREDGLEQCTALTNLSEQDMPAMLGYHTTFDLLGFSNGKVCVGVEVDDLLERDMSTYLPTGRVLEEDAVTRALKMSDFNPYSQKISRHYRAMGQGNMTLFDPVRGIGIRYWNDASFGWRLIYNGEADRYICLEPQTCAIDCLNAPYPKGYANVPSIAPGQTVAYHSKIQLFKGEAL